MNEAGFPVISLANHKVWNAILSYKIGPPDTALSFSQRLARENGWTAAKAERIISEYKRFCFLAVVTNHAVTPSDAIDQVWHLHLTYTRDYWERFCPEVLGRPLHHGPTAGGDAELHRYFDQYAQTLKSYEEIFGECPPEDLWPKADRMLRYDPQSRRVHPAEMMILPKWVLWVIGAGTGIILSMCMVFK
jgi:hypothetical protein